MKNLIKVILLYIFLIIVILYGKDITAGVKNGIEMSLNLVIPSMFLFIVISNFIIGSSLKEIIARPFKFITKKFFKLNSEETAVFILSLVGGYPVGAKLLSNCVKSKTITPEKASIMLSYCVNCGPAFLISGIGTIILGNMQLGLIMYISQITACFVVGRISTIFISKQNKENICKVKKLNNNKTTISTLLISSVVDAVKSMGIICGFVVFFCAINPIILQLLGKYIDSVILNGILEVTAGCTLVTTKPPLYAILYASSFVAFGGICVIMQIFAMLVETGITMKYFFILKPIYIITNVGVTYILLKIFPQTLLVFEEFCTINCFNTTINNSNGEQITQNLYSVSPIATIFMIILAILLLFYSTKHDIIEKDFIK